MKRVIIPVLILFLLGCKTTEVPDYGVSTSLLGVVFDNKSNPVQNAKISFSSIESDKVELIVNSDIDGKFLIPDLDFGEYSVVVTAKNCTPTTTVVDHYDIENVLIIKLYTFDDLLEDFETHINSNNLTAAEKKMEQLDEINPDDNYFNFIKATYFIKTGEYNQAETILINILPDTENSPYVNLLLADLYQYYLLDKAKALFHLEQFLNSNYTLKETDRFEELNNDIKNTEG